MDDAARIGWTTARAEERRTSYRRVLGIYLALLVLLGLLAILAPIWLSWFLHLPTPYPAGWLRAWGGMQLAIALFWAAGFQDPVRSRWSNLAGIASAFWMMLLFVFQGGGFLWLALLHVVFGILLARAYLALFRAELMSRP